MVLLNQLKDDDISPLIDVFQAIDSSDIDAVDIILDHESTSVLNEKNILSLINAVKLKLQVIDLSNASVKDFLRSLTLSIPLYHRCHILVVLNFYRHHYRASD